MVILRWCRCHFLMGISTVKYSVYMRVTLYSRTALTAAVCTEPSTAETAGVNYTTVLQ